MLIFFQGCRHLSLCHRPQKNSNDIKSQCWKYLDHQSMFMCIGCLLAVLLGSMNTQGYELQEPHWVPLLNMLEAS